MLGPKDCLSNSKKFLFLTQQYKQSNWFELELPHTCKIELTLERKFNNTYLFLVGVCGCVGGCLCVFMSLFCYLLHMSYVHFCWG